MSTRSDLNDRKRYLGVWSTLSSSGNRSDAELYLAAKAREHAEIVRERAGTNSCVDLGCGAGELLRLLVTHLNILVGVDYSASMISEARKIIQNGTELVVSDCLEYAPSCQVPIWLTTGALNQYLSPGEIIDFLKLFSENDMAKSLFLFDCVDPIRHEMTGLGTSFRRRIGKNNSFFSLYSIGQRCLSMTRLASRVLLAQIGKAHHKYRNPHMGYGYLPSFWLNMAELHGLHIEILGSRYFEYRYHVVLSKKIDVNSA